ncbi:MAG TPA: M28 family peptidase, partial [Thermoanaerobaculia bacterium]
PLKQVAAYINFDMVGRMQNNKLAADGVASSPAWSRILERANVAAGFDLATNPDPYQPTDSSNFNQAGLPTLFFTTGSHPDYHRPSDTADKINAAGGARVATLVADLAVDIAGRAGRPTYKSAPAPAPAGDVRSYGATLGTVPDYAGDGRPGVLLAGVRAGSAAEQGGLRRGDLLVGLSGKEIRDIHDFMFVLQRAKPGEKAAAVVVRDGQKVEMEVTFGGKKP